MKKLFYLIALVVLSVFTLTSCSLLNGSKITYDEYKQIKDGMSYKEVCKIIGGEGELLSSYGDAEVYKWEGVGSLGANAIVTFYDGEVMTKAQSGLK